MERSHLPFIGISLYALSLMVKEDRKYHVSFYWKYLTLISTLGIILYVGTLINSSLRAYSELKQVYIPSVSLNENLKIMESSVVKISSIDEAKSALRNASQRQGKEINLEDSDNLDSIKIKIQEIEAALLTDQYQIQERQFYEFNSSIDFSREKTIACSLTCLLYTSDAADE